MTRRWLELRLRAVDEPAEELVPDTLVELGARGVVEEEERYVAYFEEPDDLDAFLDRARESLTAAGARSAEVEWRWQEQEAWSEMWKRGLGPRRVTDRLVVHPSWKRPQDRRPDDIVIVLDPGMAFGTAEHGTTRGCLRLLDERVRPGHRILDVGAGSGILAIAAARLGATEVVAVEGDPLACEAMEGNLRRNRVVRRVRVVEAWADTDTLAAEGTFDGVVANIETGLLCPLLPGLAAAAGREGWLVLSGILDHEWDDVEEEMRALGFTAAGRDADGEWRSGVFERHD